MGLTREQRGMPARVRLAVVATTASAAVAATAVAVKQHSHGWHDPSLGVAAIFVVLLASTDRLAIRFTHAGSAEMLCAFEGLVAPLIFWTSATTVVSLAAIGVGLAQLVNRNSFGKGLFNVSQWVLACVAGEVVWRALHLASDGSVASIGGLLLALVTTVTVNQLLISGILWLATGHPLGTDNEAGAARLVRGRLINFALNAVLGIMTTAVYFWQPWAVAVVAVPLWMLHSAGRAEASVLSSQLRLMALQRAGSHLSASVDRSALQPFLDEVRVGFGVQAIQLVLFADGPGAPEVYIACDDDLTPLPAVALADMLASQVSQPTHLAVGGDDETAGLLGLLAHRGALVAPLTGKYETLGMLMLFDRVGVEGFESGELTVAGALARELVSFLERVDLVAAIEDERRKLADVVDHTSDGIISISSDGTVLSWNAGMAAMTGYTAEEMVGTRHLGLLRPRDAHGNDLNPLNWTRTVVENSLATEMQIVTAGGATVWTACSYSVIPGADGGRDVLVGVARNITQARELELLKDDFVAVVSHELRTPLVPIKGWAQTLLNRGDRLTEAQRRTAVQSILSQAQRLESLVLNILESSRVEAGHVESLDVVDVASVAVHVAEDVLAARPERVIRVRPPSVPCHVRGSGVWVERAIANLVANAVKYSSDEEPVDVLVSAEGGQVSVSVTDRGPGIPADAQDRIFARFERLEGSRKQTGTGLGLYITRRLARGMGGDVTVSSLPGAGSTFVLSLPALAAGDGRRDLALPSPRAAGLDPDPTRSGFSAT